MTNSPDGTDERVVVVGPVIIDNYYIGSAARLDQTAAVPIVDVHSVFAGAGGGANAASNLAHMAMPVAFVSAVGTNPPSQFYTETQANPMITRYVMTEAEYKVPSKHRLYSSDNRLIARWDVEPPSPPVEDQIVDLFRKALDDAPTLAILVSDYDKGICTERTIGVIMDEAKARKIPVIVDPSPNHLEFYTDAHILTPSGRELLQGSRCTDLQRGLATTMMALSPKYCVVTLGEDGMLIGQRNQKPIRVPPAAAQAVDTCGAGDAVAAALTYGVATGIPAPQLFQFAAIAGAIEVELPGAVPVSLHNIHRRLSSGAGRSKKRISLDEALLLRQSVSVAKGSFGVANGIFDVLHPGHVSMLMQAREACDFLCVLLNSDESAARIKREPIQDAGMRAAALFALPEVDAIVVFDGDTPVPELTRLHPSMMAKGPEFADKVVPGASMVTGYGGKVLITEREVDISTTAIRDRAVALNEADTQTAPPDSAS